MNGQSHYSGRREEFLRMTQWNNYADTPTWREGEKIRTREQNKTSRWGKKKRKKEKQKKKKRK
ncbi:hypothetical protein I7I48_01893 [Histoplasma ohiense]|nr:hypothetical protein I7I48_01893 [Histoplasma ohiense (nom. inval.)]